MFAASSTALSAADQRQMGKSGRTALGGCEPMGTQCPELDLCRSEGQRVSTTLGANIA